MKQKLGQMGYSHGLLLIAIVVAGAITGTAYQVSAREHKNAVLGASTSSNVNNVSCQIKRVSKHPKHGSVISPSLVIKNSADTKYDLNVSYAFSITDKYGQPHSDIRYDGGILGQLNPKAKLTSKLQKYSVEYRSDTKLNGTYKVTSKDPNFTCSVKFTLPKKPKNAKPDNPAPDNSGIVHGIM